MSSGIYDDYKDMTLIHSKDYVLKVARELNIEDVRSQVSRWFISRGLDGNLSTEEAIFFLRLFYTDDIRYILTFNMNETLKATQLLREVREDWSDAGQVSQKLVEVFELLHRAGHEFDEEYLSKALEYLEMAIKNGE
jgi:hypothetical protein